MQAPAEKRKPNRQQKEKYLHSIFNAQTLKKLVQVMLNQALIIRNR